LELLQEPLEVLVVEALVVVVEVLAAVRLQEIAKELGGENHETN
jgi:hypothetical protein